MRISVTHTGCTPHQTQILHIRMVAPFLTNYEKIKNQGVKYWGKEIERRLRLSEEFGKDYPGKPVRTTIRCIETYTHAVCSLQFDVLSFLIDYSTGEDRTVRNLVSRILLLIFASLHTTSMVSHSHHTVSATVGVRR